jgi:1-phosphofructokinase
VAGIVAAQVSGLPLPECARLATAFSLSWLTRAGAGTDERAGVAAFAGQVEIVSAAG